MAGEDINGILFSLNDSVEVIGGPHKGDVGAIITITELAPDPEYLVENSNGKDLKVIQSNLVRI